MREEPTGCPNRAVALGGLALYGPVVVLLLLTRPYPAPPAPPQLDSTGHGNILGGLVVGFACFTTAVAIGLAMRNGHLSLHRQQWLWSVAFVALGLVGLLVPVLFLLQTTLIQPQRKGVTLVSAVGVLLIFLASLLFAPRYPDEAWGHSVSG
jgi:F0F1-type ATP synthase membrane subunit c/vacuolar-type H+-ATPase subunit K